MTKRIKNDLGEYDVLTARSKKSEKECRKIMDDKIRDYYIQQEEQKHKGVSSEMPFKEFADNWFELNVKNADCSQVNKENYKNILTHILFHTLKITGFVIFTKMTANDF
jgi:hypothetical protein